MCAIAGIVGNKLEKIHAMTEIIKHRGPDDSKIEIILMKLVNYSISFKKS